MTLKILLPILAMFALGSCTFEETNNQTEQYEELTPYTGPAMMGFPATPESQVTLMNWSRQPYSKWSFRNPSLLPSLMVARGGDVFTFPEKPDPGLAGLRLTSSPEMSVVQALEADDTDGIIVIKDGVVVFEKYFGGFEADDLHIWASCTKSLMALAISVLEEQGKLNLDDKVETYLPEMKDSGFEGLTIRHLLNMTTALDYSENYADLKPGTVHYEYFRRIGLTPAFDLMAMDPRRDDTPRGNWQFINRIQRKDDVEPGTVFEYQSPNVDAIGLIISRVSGEPLNEFVSRNIWKKLGTEHDALFGADASFNPIATGGFMTTLRDMARFGYAVLNNGMIDGREVFPPSFITSTFTLSEEELQAGAKSAYRIDPASPIYDARLSGYKNFWWIHSPEVMMARGVFGQGIYIDRKNNVVIATMGSAPSASNAARPTWKAKVEAMEVLAGKAE